MFMIPFIPAVSMFLNSFFLAGIPFITSNLFLAVGIPMILVGIGFMLQELSRYCSKSHEHKISKDFIYKMLVTAIVAETGFVFLAMFLVPSLPAAYFLFTILVPLILALVGYIAGNLISRSSAESNFRRFLIASIGRIGAAFIGLGIPLALLAASFGIFGVSIYSTVALITIGGFILFKWSGELLKLVGNGVELLGAMGVYGSNWMFSKNFKGLSLIFVSLFDSAAQLGREIRLLGEGLTGYISTLLSMLHITSWSDQVFITNEHHEPYVLSKPTSEGGAGQVSEYDPTVFNNDVAQMNHDDLAYLQSELLSELYQGAKYYSIDERGFYPQLKSEQDILDSANPSPAAA
jgi:hypothetical protein